METSSNWLINASLGLNINTLQLLDDSPGRDEIRLEVQSCSPEAGSKEHQSLNLYKDEARALREELNRVSAENKQLSEMLTLVSQKYIALRTQLNGYIMTNDGSSIPTSSHCHTTDINNHEATVAAGALNDYCHDVVKKRKADSCSNSANSSSNNSNVVVGRLVPAASGHPAAESSSSDEAYPRKKPKEETIKSKIYRTYVRSEDASDTSLIVKDGYLWRKYGQKVTRDNPSPRAYFKCSFAPSCQVKKKVQRSIDDQAVIVSTYEGEHNHPPLPSPQHDQAVASARSNQSICPVNPDAGSVLRGGSTTCLLTSLPAATKALDHLQSDNKNQEPNVQKNNTATAATQGFCSSAAIDKMLMEIMATSLTKDPKIASALAAAISRRFFP